MRRPLWPLQRLQRLQRLRVALVPIQLFVGEQLGRPEQRRRVAQLKTELVGSRLAGVVHA